MSLLIAVALVALDTPPGGGLPEMFARFQDESAPPVTATFAGGPPTAVEVEWFIDGDGSMMAPAAREVIDVTPSPGAPLAKVAIPVRLPEVKKPTAFRAAMRVKSGEEEWLSVGGFRLMLFPARNFDQKWKRVAGADVPITISGPLAGLRELFERYDIRFREGHPQQLETIDRNGLLVMESTDSNPGLAWPGQARAILVYADSAEGLRIFGEAKDGDNLLWVGGPPRLSFTDDPVAQQILLQLLEPLLEKPKP